MHRECCCGGVIIRSRAFWNVFIQKDFSDGDREMRVNIGICELTHPRYFVAFVIYHSQFRARNLQLTWVPL